ncbi:unnamed protein product [Allacma fusca]|uniref:Major facilitator superfamily (MFS) profile domain-containing protein n=1 Tax=Allacma fusca TaxID=39272 RepID=A0A8J2Q6Q1_9HEXA|nr:unnamed protein product [Allacma fusca]
MKENGGTQDWEQAAKNLKDFDDILEIVGSEGKYQKLMLYGVMTPLTIVCPFLVLQWIFMLSVPDHWCHVPGRPDDMDPLAWKNLTVPTEIGPDGQVRFSQCEMYDVNRSKVRCDQWDYDTTNYDATIPSEYNWVCDNAHYVADAHSAGTFGNVLGTIVLGTAADKFGRKPIYFLTLVIFIVFYYASIFLSSNFLTFIILKFLSGTAFPFMFSSPCMIAAELSGKNYRAWIYSCIWMVWVFGNCLVPLVAYVTRHWFSFGVISALPAVFLFLYYKILQESPRWLISIGRMDDAGKIIESIAKYNGTEIHPELLKCALANIKKDFLEKQEGQKTLGVWSLFTRKRIAMNTILLCIAWSINCLIYYGLTLNTTSMSGNQFFNYFLLGIVELPAGWLGGVLVNKSGRRWTQAFFFILCALGFVIAAISVFNPDLAWTVLAAALCGKFCVSVTSLVVYLQGTELFPTQLRSTGSGFTSTVSSLIGVLGPYIVYLGKFHAAGPYAVLAFASLIGTLSSACLPETLDQKLPESLEDAAQFGKHQKFWSYLPKDESTKEENVEKSP